MRDLAQEVGPKFCLRRYYPGESVPVHVVMQKGTCAELAAALQQDVADVCAWLRCTPADLIDNPHCRVEWQVLPVNP